MAVRDLNVKTSVPRLLRWLPIAVAAVIVAAMIWTQNPTVRYQDFTLNSSVPAWFDAHAPNGSYSFVAVTAPKATKAPKPTNPPPDADGDGIPDANDACPNVGGPADFQGCPPPTSTPKPILPNLPTTGQCVLATQTGLSVNVREQAATSSRIVGSISYQQIVPVLAQTTNDAGESWYQVDAGFVAARVARLGGDCSSLQTAGAANTPTGAAPTVPTVAPPTGGDAGSAPIPAASGPLAIDTTNAAAGNSRGILQLLDTTSGQREFLLAQNGATSTLPAFGATGMLFPALQPTNTGIAFFTGDLSSLIDLRLASLENPSQSTVVLSARPDLKIAPFPPVWSPDGAALLVTLVDPVTNTSAIYRLTFANGALGGPALLVANAFAPAFSPDGTSVAYVAGSLLSRSVHVLTLANNATQAVTGSAPFTDCTTPVFGVSPTDLLFVCNAMGQILLVRSSGGAITPVASPVSSFVTVVSTTSGTLLVGDGSRVFAAPLSGLVFTPLIDGGGKQIEYLQWLQGEGIPTG